jgi:hypothetical protein
MSTPIPAEVIDYFNLVAPIEIMKFSLIYEGQLRAAGGGSRKSRASVAAEKRNIRNYLHPQLLKLWQTNAILKRLSYNAIAPKEGGCFVVDRIDNVESKIKREPGEGEVDLCEPIVISGAKMCPLIRRSLHLTCGLNVIFFRDEEPGDLIHGGDIDNRLLGPF